ncbi:MAG: type II toxin-antitoxin system VapC family toxin [Coriobacteriia bacterium]|nr:type II toxin-antitoxin system VapC family toxin [Coriobacteriia bacterium]
MSQPPRYVLDASVGVKWFRQEDGSTSARLLQQRFIVGEAWLAAPTHFVHEVLATVKREKRPDAVLDAWRIIQASGITIISLSDEVIVEAVRQCEALGCSFYDSLAPACASLLGATLASADARAHGAYPGVHMIGAEE